MVMAVMKCDDADGDFTGKQNFRRNQSIRNPGTSWARCIFFSYIPSPARRSRRSVQTSIAPQHVHVFFVWGFTAKPSRLRGFRV